MANPQSSIGTRIRDLRHMRGMTQGDLAAACEVSRSAVAQWETDRAGQLRGNISRIANALGVSTEHLLHGDQAGQGILGDELAMLRLYRSCLPEDQSFLLRTARRLAITSDSRGSDSRGEAEADAAARPQRAGSPRAGQI